MVAEARGLLLDELELEACQAALGPYDPYLASDEESAWSENDNLAEMALSETPMAEQEEAPVEAQPAAHPGGAHARRRAARSGRLSPAAEPAAATDTTEQATPEGARRNTAGGGPGCHVVARGVGGDRRGGWWGCWSWADRFELLCALLPYTLPCTALSSHLPTARHSPPRARRRPPWTWTRRLGPRPRQRHLGARTSSETSIECS